MWILEQWYCCGEGISPLYQDLIPFLLAFSIFSYEKLLSEGSSLMESRAVVLAPPC